MSRKQVKPRHRSDNTSIPILDAQFCQNRGYSRSGKTEVGEGMSEATECKYVKQARELKQQQIPIGVIESLSIGVYNDDLIEKESVVTIDSDEHQGFKTVNDPRMGSTERNIGCRTCGEGQCSGHIGHINLSVPLYHYAFIRTAAEVLTCICPGCAKLMITEEQIKENDFDKALDGNDRTKLIYEYSKSSKKKKGKMIVRCRDDCQQAARIYFSRDKSQVVIKNENKRDVISNEKVQVMFYQEKRKDAKDELFSAKEAKELLKRFEENDPKGVRMLGIHRPSALIMEKLVVTPPNVRSDAIINGSIIQNNITDQYIEIIKNNKIIRDLLQKRNLTEKETKDLENRINTLKFSIKRLMKNPEEGQKGYLDIIGGGGKAKEGLLRSNFMGKRTEFNARAVANPDPSLKFGEVLVPKRWRSQLTVPVKVNNINKSYLQGLLENGHVEFIKSSSGSLNYKQFRANRMKKYQLQIGDVVHRWLQEGDIVILNRQPSLHRFNMLGRRVKFSTDPTSIVLGTHLSDTSPLNMDYDGDAINIHVPQDIDSISEVSTIMGSRNCILNEAGNRPIAGLVFDAPMAFANMTSEKTILDRAEFNDIILTSYPGNFYYDAAKHQKKVKKYGINPYSGYSLFSDLLPGDFNYAQKDVFIKNGVLLQGPITKEDIGNSQSGLIRKLSKEYGNKVAEDFITRATLMANQYMTYYPVSIGYEDCKLVNERSQEEFKKIQNADYLKFKSEVMMMGGERENPLEEQFKETQILTSAKNLTNRLGKKAYNNLDTYNTILLALNSGAKGSKFNLIQIQSMLGQQFFYGGRSKMNLSYFPAGELNPESKGFIPNSFTSGLTASEYFFHQASSRPGMIDKSNKVQETGAMERRFIKQLENLSVNQKGEVRNKGGQIIQFVYGDDGLSAEHMIRQSTSSGKTTMFIDLHTSVANLNSKYGY